MATSFTIAQGEILRIRFIPRSDSAVVTIEPTWEVSSYMKKQGSRESINLNPVIDTGVAVVEYDTIELPIGTYIIDFRITDDSPSDTFSGKFTMYLVDTITPPSNR